MLDKAIIHKKEYRKLYRKSKRFDRSCRNNGSCSYCKSNRLFFDKKRRESIELDFKEYNMKLCIFNKKEKCNYCLTCEDYFNLE